MTSNAVELLLQFDLMHDMTGRQKTTDSRFYFTKIIRFTIDNRQFQSFTANGTQYMQSQFTERFFTRSRFTGHIKK